MAEPTGRPGGPRPRYMYEEAPLDKENEATARRLSLRWTVTVSGRKHPVKLVASQRA